MTNNESTIYKKNSVIFIVFHIYLQNLSIHCCKQMSTKPS